jgi:hypothetical protein
MRRRVMALTVAAVMAAMMVASPAGPAFAADYCYFGECSQTLWD